jgi:hypothetical protein
MKITNRNGLVLRMNKERITRKVLDMKVKQSAQEGD